MSDDTRFGAASRAPAPTGAENRLCKSLTHNLLAQSKMGCSKHEAKAKAREDYLAEFGTLEGWNPAKVDGIFSRNTMSTYIHEMAPFAGFCASQGAKRIGDLTETMGADYLKAMHADGKSDWSIATASAAINKAMGWSLSPKKLGLPARKKENITRSRLPREHDKRDFSKNSDQITFAKGTGVRRMSITVVRPCDCVRDADGNVIGVAVREKGGRRRVAPILNSHRKAITNIVNNATIENGEDSPIFTKYDGHIDNHRFRAEYAASLLHQLEDERATGQALFGGSFKIGDYCHLRGKDAKRKAKTAGHDTDLLGAVSGALGHNRVEIVLRHYLYLY